MRIVVPSSELFSGRIFFIQMCKYHIAMLKYGRDKSKATKLDSLDIVVMTYGIYDSFCNLQIAITFIQHHSNAQSR